MVIFFWGHLDEFLIKKQSKWTFFGLTIFMSKNLSDALLYFSIYPFKNNLPNYVIILLDIFFLSDITTESYLTLTFAIVWVITKTSSQAKLIKAFN